MFTERGDAETFAKTLSYELQDPFERLDLSAITDRQLVEFIRTFEGGILYIGDLDGAQRRHRSQLLTLLLEGKVATRHGNTIYCSWLTVIGSVTSKAVIDPEMEAAFPIHFRFGPYGEEDLVTVTLAIAQDLEVHITYNDACALAEASAGNVRQLRRLLINYRVFGDVAVAIAAIRAGQVLRLEARAPNIRRTIPKEVKNRVWRRDSGRCVQCGSNEKLEYDHVIPVSRGGSNTERNLQLLCEPCNRQKGSSI